MLNMRRSIWIQIIIGASGTVLAALIIYLSGYFTSIFGLLFNAITSFLKYLKSSFKIPTWLLWLLIMGCIPTVFRIVKILLPINYQSTYREDKFFGVIWRWSYPLSPSTDRLRCFCPRCDILDLFTNLKCFLKMLFQSGFCAKLANKNMQNLMEM
jgi:hypothetical protein